MSTGDERASLVRSSRREDNCVSCSGLVSIVIPCYNPGLWLFEAISSAAQQSHPRIEIIVVNDGTDDENSRAILEQAAGNAHVYLEQPNRGLPAARNAGFAAAAGEFVLPLDADDRILPSHLAECLAALNAHPDAAFAYTGFHMFGDMEQTDLLPEYNFHRLLDQNILVYAGLIRKKDWDAVGGYDESMRHGYEDWEFWVRLGAHGRFGVRVPQALFEYRKHGTSLYTTALAKHDEIVAYIRRKHARLYAPESRARLKAQWLPAVCVVGAEDARHSIADVERLPASEYPHVLGQTRAEAILLASGQVDSTSAELCALAVWSAKQVVRLPDGSQCFSRAALEALSPVDAHTSRLRPATKPLKSLLRAPGQFRIAVVRVVAATPRRDAHARHPAWRQAASQPRRGPRCLQSRLLSAISTQSADPRRCIDGAGAVYSPTSGRAPPDRTICSLARSGRG